MWIGDEDQFAGVGRHSWESFCDDCGFVPDKMLPQWVQLAQKLLPAWTKVSARIDAEHALCAPEKALPVRMTEIFHAQADNVLSMFGKA